MRATLLLALLSISSLAFAAAPTAEQVLAQARAASGGDAWNTVHSLRSEATVEVGGLSGSASSLQDLLTGRWVTQGMLGSYRFAQGFDGKMGWSESPNGEVSPNDTPAAKKRDATNAYHTEQAWWFPERWPAKIELLGTREDDGTTYQVLRFMPRGCNPFEMWINAKTHLIARIVDRSGTVPVTTYLSDYRTVDGVKISFHQRTSNGKRQYDNVAQLKTVALNVPVSDADFAMPKQATPATVVGWGVGGKATGRIARGGELKIGSVVIDDPVLELSLATRGAGADKHIAGNIGGGILNRFTVTLDYAHQRMYLKPNEAYGTPMTYDRSGM